MAVTVKAEMAGLIEDITAAPGETVGKDHEILIMSSMKMEIPVVAGTDGRIAEILVETGDAVKAGDHLFTIKS